MSDLFVRLRRLSLVTNLHSGLAVWLLLVHITSKERRTEHQHQLQVLGPVSTGQVQRLLTVHLD